MVDIVPENFSAWINKQPPGPASLIVNGTITVPTGGWSASLTRAQPQGTNPNILLLDLRLSKPTGTETQVISDITGRYEESPPAREYTDVTITHADGSFTIPVRIVQ
jgi:hypothetical protein